MQAPPNPFCYDEPLSPTCGCVFAQDPNVERVAIDLIARQCCLVVGPPGSGTSTTMLGVRDAYRRKLPEAIWWAIDLARLPTKDINSLFVALAVDGTSLFRGQASLWSEVENDRDFCHALARSAERIRLPIVLAIDHIENVPPDVAQVVVRGVRSIYSRRDGTDAPQRLISVIIAGSRRLWRQGEGRGSPLNFARVYYTRDLNPRSAKDLLLTAGNERLWRFDAEAAHYLADVTGGDKYLIQRLGYECVERLAEHTARLVTVDLAEDVVTAFVKAGFREDLRLQRLLPSILRDPETLKVILDLLAESAADVSMVRFLRTDISPDVTSVFKQTRDKVGIRNQIYLGILQEHKEVLEAVYSVYRSSQHRLVRARQLQRLISQAGMSSANEDVLKSTLRRLRSYVGCKEVVLFTYDSVRDQLRFSGAAANQMVIDTIPQSLQSKLISALRAGGGLIPCRSIGDESIWKACFDVRFADCSWVPLIDRNTETLTGVLALVGHTLVLSAQERRELMELSLALSETLQFKRYLEAFQRLSHLSVDLSLDAVRCEICDTISSLFDKGYALIWQGSVKWPPIPVRTAVGIDERYWAKLGLMERKDTCLCPDQLESRTWFISRDRQDQAPMCPNTLWETQLQSVLLASSLLQDDQAVFLGIGASHHWQPTDIEIALAKLVAKQTAVILDNIAIYRQVRQRLEADQFAVPLLSHELNRQPAAIAEELELILAEREGPITPSQRKALERSQGYITRHQLLIKRLLDVTRLDSGTFQARMSVQPIRPILHCSLSRLAEKAERLGTRLLIDLPADLPRHRLDPVLIDRTMTELIRNAIRYSEQEPIRVRVRTDRRSTVITVEDTGPGIARGFRELVFEPWHRGSASQHHAGNEDNLGLGLYFVRKFVELHDGRVSYDETYEEGARFVVMLPRVEGG